MSYHAKSRRPLRRIGMGSNQSMPQTHRMAPRTLDGFSPSTFSPSRSARRSLGASAMEYATKPVIVAVPPTPIVKNYRPASNVRLLGGGSDYNAWTGLGSLGDDAEAPASPSIGVDPVTVAQQQLNELKVISAAQVEFTRREAQQRWFQIGATLLIPLSAAIWRAIFRSGRSSTKDFE